MTTLNYCGLSGGKDSAATGLWLIRDSGAPCESLRFTFCNTHNEHRFTYEHIELLDGRFAAWGVPPHPDNGSGKVNTVEIGGQSFQFNARVIKWLEPERGFFELAKWKKRFPSRKARFCTQFLKVIPSREDVTKLIESGHEVIVHSGVRATESVDRAKLVERGFDDMFGCVVNRPLLYWSLQNVLDYHKRFDLPLNPLYGYGATRVGCFPCINSRKSEIKLISINFPERIDELRKQERQIGKISTFFARKTVPERFRSLMVDTKSGPMKVATIDDVVRWSHTGKRAKEVQPYLADDFNDDATLVCPSGAGVRMTLYRDPEQGSSKPLAHLPLFDQFPAAARKDVRSEPKDAPLHLEARAGVGVFEASPVILSGYQAPPAGIHATARSTDPDTSHESAKAFTEQRLTEIQSAVFELFTIRRRLTDEEIEDALSSKYPAFSTLRKRRTDLVQMGLIRDSGERKLNRNNRNMIAWEIAP